jgi:hypothetical protein
MLNSERAFRDHSPDTRVIFTLPKAIRAMKTFSWYDRRHRRQIQVPRPIELRP